MDTKHELYMDPVAGVNMVYDKTMRRGLELDTHILPADGLDIYARYTYEKAFFIGSHYAGNEVPMVPTQMLTWGVNYTFMDCVDFTYRFNFVGPRRLISDQRNIGRQLKQYITNDIRLGYRKHGFEVYGALNNILDFKYSEIGTWGTYFPANGRNFLFGVKQKF
jgi:outer membrane receptor protein involved in Fe transport